MNLWNIIGLAFCALISVLILRESRKEYIPYILLSFGLLIFFAILPVWNNAVSWLTEIHIYTPYGKILFKALGVTVLTEVASDICKTAGESSIASYVTLAGKGELLLLCLPLLQELIILAADFLDV